MSEQEYFEDLLKRYPILTSIGDSIMEAYYVMENTFNCGGKLLLAGNGGSCADSEHILGELMKSFVKRRPISEDFEKILKEVDDVRGENLSQHLQGALPAITLTGNPALSSAYLNDADGNLIYAQQLYGYGRCGDTFLGISTSGNAENILNAAVTAKAMGIKVIGLTGGDGGALAKIADVAIIAPECETYKIQELHLPVYHTLCLMLEEHFFEK